MFGDGDMFVPNANSMPSPTVAQPSENLENSTASEVGQESRTPYMTSISFGDDESSYQPTTPPPTPVAAISAALQTMAKKLLNQQWKRRECGTCGAPCDFNHGIL